MEKYLESIIELIQNGDVEEGLKSLSEFERHADHQDKYDLAELYNELGRPDKAKPLIEELISNYPDEGELLILAAETAIDMDQEDEAIEWLLEIDKKDEGYLRAQMLLADLYQLQGLDEAAENKLKNALELAPEEPVLVAGLGDYYLERGDYAKSIPYLKQAERLGFQFPEGSLDLRLAEAYSATGDFESALMYYEKGLKEKTDIHSLFGYGYTALQIEDYELAARQLERLKELDHEYVTLYPYLIRAYEGMENFEQALKVAEQGLSVDEYNDALYTEAGKLQMALGNEKDAEEKLREALSLNPGNMDAANAVLSLWIDQEDYESIIDLVTHLKEAGEEDPRLEWYFGKATWEMEDFEEAFKAYKNAEPAYSENEEFLKEFGHLLLELGYKEKAIHYLKAASNLEPGNESLHQLIEELEFNHF